MEYSVVRPSGDFFDRTIATAYERATANAANSKELAQNSTWLWGTHASAEDYMDQDPRAHQLSGEIQHIGQGYRGDEYYRCFDPITKTLVPDFTNFVLDSTLRYVGAAQEFASPRAEVLIALDHAKQYSLTLFHAAQYPARSRLLSRKEQETTARFAESATHLTRAFYYGILGHDMHRIQEELEWANEALQDEHLAKAAVSIPSAMCKAQEMDQPLTILSSALLAVDRHENVDIIYALPAGGTQLAIVTQLLFELKDPYRTPPALHYLPISTHATSVQSMNNTAAPTAHMLAEHADLAGKNVLICEDNSTSGNTISLAHQVITAERPASCHVAVVEFDPRRLTIKRRYPNPSVNVADYRHPDFTSNVGIIPVTVGEYPDYQMRKLVPLRLARAMLRDGFGVTTGPDTEVDYEALRDYSQEFETFYEHALARSVEAYGYASPYQVAALVVSQHVENKLLPKISIEDKYRLAQKLSYAAVRYPFLPVAVRKQLMQSAETSNFKPDGPWLQKGTHELLTAFLSYAKDNGSEVIIWTEGDGAHFAHPPHVGLDEQRERYQLSGLEHTLLDITGDSSKHFRFLAHPKKTKLLATGTLHKLRQRLPHITDIVIIESDEQRLAEAQFQIECYNYTAHPITMRSQQSGLVDLVPLTESVNRRIWGRNALFLVEMNGILLHDSFRAYHQPRNMALALINERKKLVGRNV